MREHKKPIGPLHGLPISVKEHMGMKDLGLNTGLAAWAENKAEDDAAVLKILWQAGCVFHAPNDAATDHGMYGSGAVITNQVADVQYCELRFRKEY